MPVPSIPRCIVGADTVRRSSSAISPPSASAARSACLASTARPARSCNSPPAAAKLASAAADPTIRRTPGDRLPAVQPQRPVARAEPGMAARTAVVGPFQRHRPEHRDEPLRAMPGQARPSAACARPPRALVRPVAVAARLHDAGRRFLQPTRNAQRARARRRFQRRKVPARRGRTDQRRRFLDDRPGDVFGKAPLFDRPGPARRKPRLAQALAHLDQLRRQRPQALALRAICARVSATASRGMARVSGLPSTLAVSTRFGPCPGSPSAAQWQPGLPHFR